MLETSSISAIKKELKQMPKELLIEKLLRLAKYKKESKELLNYLLFEAHDEGNYIRQIKEEVEAEFKTINHASIYYVKKGVQRIHRILNKYIRYSGKKTTQIELLIFFCQQLRSCKTNYKQSKVLNNLYERQLVAISKALTAVHEDVRLDYESDLKQIL